MPSPRRLGGGPRRLTVTVASAERMKASVLLSRKDRTIRASQAVEPGEQAFRIEVPKDVGANVSVVTDRPGTPVSCSVLSGERRVAEESGEGGLDRGRQAVAANPSRRSRTRANVCSAPSFTSSGSSPNIASAESTPRRTWGRMKSTNSRRESVAPNEVRG